MKRLLGCVHRGHTLWCAAHRCRSLRLLIREHEATVVFNHWIEPCFCINLFLNSVMKTIIKEPEEKRDFWLPLPDHSPSLLEAKAGTHRPWRKVTCWLAPTACSVCFLIRANIVCLGMTPPMEDGNLTNHYQRMCSVDLPTGQFEKDFLTWSFFFPDEGPCWHKTSQSIFWVSKYISPTSLSCFALLFLLLHSS